MVLRVHVFHFTSVCVVLFFKASFSCFDINYYHRFILINYDYLNVFFISDVFFFYLSFDTKCNWRTLSIYLLFYLNCVSELSLPAELNLN